MIWQPFSSVTSSKEIIEPILKEKQKQKMPIISEEQISLIEQNLINAYYTQTTNKITYYKNGNIYTINSKIKKIDHIYKMIYLDNLKILFSQIIKIEN